MYLSNRFTRGWSIHLSEVPTKMLKRKERDSIKEITDWISVHIILSGFDVPFLFLVKKLFWNKLLIRCHFANSG